MPTPDDAFKILLDYLRHRDLPENFRFDECQMLYRMLKQNGMIRRDKTFIHYLFEWEGEDWYMNASGYFDRICKKYSIYPKYLNLGTTN